MPPRKIAEGSTSGPLGYGPNEQPLLHPAIKHEFNALKLLAQQHFAKGR